MQKALGNAVRVVGEAAEKARPHVEEAIVNVKDKANHVEEWVKDEKNIETVKIGAKAAAQEVGDRFSLWNMVMKRPNNFNIDCQFCQGESWARRWNTHDGCSWNHHRPSHRRSQSAGLHSERHCR